MWVIAIIFSLIGVIMCIAAHVGASASTDVGFEVKNLAANTKGSWTAATTDTWGYSIHYEESRKSDCSTIYSNTKVWNGAGSQVSFLSACSGWGYIRAQWEKDNDPPLTALSTLVSRPLFASDAGTYEIQSTVPVWVVDKGEEMGEAVGGVLAAGGVFIGGLLVMGIGSCLCCVACCCMCTSDSPGGGGGPTTVVVGQRTE